MYGASLGFLEKQAKEGTARNHGKDRAGIAVGKETGDMGRCLLLQRDGHRRSSSCLVLLSSSQPPALWFRRALGDLSESLFFFCASGLACCPANAGAGV